jgi:restriction system protein
LASSQYWIEISNSYLGKHRRVTGRTRREVKLKANEQLQRWSEQEARARHRAMVSDARQAAAEATEDARALMDEYREILTGTLAVDDRLNWESLVDRTLFPKPPPRPDASHRLMRVPRERPFLEGLRPALKARREEAERAAEEAERKARTMHARAVRAWEEEKTRYEDEQRRRNEEVAEFRRSYEAGERAAVEQYVSLVLAGSSLPDGIDRACQVSFSPPDQTLVINADVPAFSALPTVIEHRYVASRGVTEERHLKEKDAAELYEDVILQLLLRTIHEVFEGDYAERVSLTVFNGYAEDVDRGTGQDFRACIVSCQAAREQFQGFDLARVDPRACFRELKGLSGSRLFNMQPVRPIRVLDTEDSRFIEAEGVLDGLELDQNLMAMEWQDFEVLVRDVFKEVFADRGGEVKVTRASRDHGIDAVIFDPDPIKGGKTIIQAKRYRAAVPPAAVRDLYGAMLHEGAGKGILVTTSWFGSQTREWAKDKPITLIDGANLLHLMQNHGHHVRIDMTDTHSDLLNRLPT